ncbi:hypothetical protein [Actinomyces viscosus]|uniref:Uncharacterized protein n=1 Tax=Actinomyces viscosus TaxID=1656 RepID=A0A3S4WL51_ACTVI|nr:hypothetical protein [Actinomyces viscosus]VEI18009.1 Uncharacterised protein [Actinomyces viscosus]
MLSDRGRRIFRIFAVVLNCVVAVVSFRRGDMALAVVFTGVALSFLGPLMRSSSGGDDDSDRRSPLAS